MRIGTKKEKKKKSFPLNINERISQILSLLPFNLQKSISHPNKIGLGGFCSIAVPPCSLHSGKAVKFGMEMLSY